MKKLLVLLMALITLFTISACSAKDINTVGAQTIKSAIKKEEPSSKNTKTVKANPVQEPSDKQKDDPAIKEKYDTLNDILRKVEENKLKEEKLLSHVGEELSELNYDNLCDNANGLYENSYIHIRGYVEEVDTQDSITMVLMSPDNMKSSRFSDPKVVIGFRRDCLASVGDYIDVYGYILGTIDELNCLGVEGYLCYDQSMTSLPQATIDSYWRDIEGGWYCVGSNKYYTFNGSDQEFYNIDRLYTKYDSADNSADEYSKVCTFYRITHRSTRQETYVLRFAKSNDIMIKTPDSSDYLYYVRDTSK